MSETNTKILFMVLISIIAIVSAFLVYGMLSNNEKESNLEVDQKDNQGKNNSKDDKTGKTYQLDDYMTVRDANSQGNLKKVEFRNLPTSITSGFITSQNKFINQNKSEYGEGQLSNRMVYGITGNLLSIYMEERLSHIMGQAYQFYTLNVNLEQETIVTNQELLQPYEISSMTMYEKILNQIADRVSTDYFLLDVDGDIMADKISIIEFRNDISRYVSELSSRYDVVSLHLYNNRVHVVYDQAAILRLLGMGVHMGIGLTSEPQIVSFNE